MTPGAFAESALYAGLSESDLKDWQLVAKVRYSLFKPGGDLAREFARNPTVLVVNDTVFAHGGLLPTHGERARTDGACGGVGVRETRGGKGGRRDEWQRYPAFRRCVFCGEKGGKTLDTNCCLLTLKLKRRPLLSQLQWSTALSGLTRRWRRGCAGTSSLTGHAPRRPSWPWGGLHAFATKYVVQQLKSSSRPRS